MLQALSLISDKICYTYCVSNEDDISSNGILLKEWVQYAQDNCKLWMHEECYTKHGVCVFVAMYFNK